MALWHLGLGLQHQESEFLLFSGARCVEHGYWQPQDTDTAGLRVVLDRTLGQGPGGGPSASCGHAKLRSLTLTWSSHSPRGAGQWLPGVRGAPGDSGLLIVGARPPQHQCWEQ